jgi:hypothetical protein
MAEAASQLDNWNIFYWVMRTHGIIAMEFKDFTEAAKVFRKLKKMSRISQKPQH